MLRSAHFSSLSIAVSSTMLTACATSSINNHKPSVTTRTPDVVNTSNLYVSDDAKLETKKQTNNIAHFDEASMNEFSKLEKAKEMAMVENNQILINNSGDLWNRVRKGFMINQSFTHNSRIEEQKKWFITHQNYIEKLTARTSRYLYHTVREAEDRGLPTELALLPIIESSYDPTKSSHAGAAGLWQFIPRTGASYGLTQTKNYDGRRDVILSTNAAYDYLSELHTRFGTWELALAAYNGGPTRVQKAIDANKAKNLPTDFWSLKLPKETMNYVPRFFAISQVIADPQSHGVSFPAVANKQHFTSIKVRNGVSLLNVAQIINIPLEEIKNLNPGMLSGRVERYAPQRIIIPNLVDDMKVSKVLNLYGVNAKIARPSTTHVSKGKTGLTSNGSNNAGIQQVKSNKKKNSNVPSKSNDKLNQGAQTTYMVKKGDTVQLIAKRAGVKWRDVIEWNQLKSDGLLHVGKKLYLYKRNDHVTLNSPKVPKHPKTYVVSRGDTLIGTAHKFGLSRQQLAKLNGLSVDAELKIGDKLALTANNVAISKRSEQKTNNVKKELAGKVGNKYYPNSGDGLLSVANKLNVDARDLAIENNLKITDNLIIGQALKIPNKKPLVKKNQSNAKTKARSSAPSHKKTNKYTGKTDNYSVKSGDTLSGIAAKRGYKTDIVASLNNVKIDYMVKIGEVIVVPARNAKIKVDNKVKKASKQTTMYRVKRGDTLLGVAIRHRVKASDLAKVNNLNIKSYLLENNVIIIPTRTANKNS